MRYFGVPTCPYCKKRVNLIRTWSLKRQGEYQCPRCGGISNIFLSPLIYVLALLAVFAGGAMYFFHKFVLDDITLETALYVFIPFAAFFLFSLFMVYLEKPVIKKVSKEEYQKKRFIRSAVDGSAGAVQRPDDRERYNEEDDYIPRGSYRPGPESPQPELPRQGVVNQAAFSRAKLQAAMENTQQSQRPAYQRPASGQQPAARPAQAMDQVPRTQAQARVQQPRIAQPRLQQQRAYGQAGQQAVQQRQVPMRAPLRETDPRQTGRAVGSVGTAAQNAANIGGRQVQGYGTPRPQGTVGRRDIE